MSEPSSIDLRRFIQAVGRFGGQRALLTSQLEREDYTSAVEMLETERKEVTADPLEIADWMDGIQASILVTHKEHRPIYLCYSAAGSVESWRKLSGLKEKLEVICSESDWEWIYPISQGLDIVTLETLAPPLLEQQAINHLSSRRAVLEKSLTEELSKRRKKGLLVIDGSLLQRPNNKKLIGLIKTTVKRYLPDESVLWGMPAGWRSPMFCIPKGRGATADRYSCYVRLFDASDKAWSFGLIRLEAYDPALLEPMAARALLERQSPAGGDPRYDRHIKPIRACEDLLRARRPSVFGLEM